MLLVSDPVLPNVCQIVAGEPMTGSWWAHPASHAIYAVLERLAERERVLLVKLLSNKQTFLHDDVRDDFLDVACAREPWQTRSLPPSARGLLARVERRGSLRLDDVASSKNDPATLRKAARELEARLLVFAESVHTKSGAHEKQLSSWKHWARTNELSLSSRRARERVEASKRLFEDLVERWARTHGKRARLPWPPSREATPK